jgi:hypothetical protein
MMRRTELKAYQSYPLIPPPPPPPTHAKNASIFWDFIKKPKKFFGSPRGHFFLHIYTYLIFIAVHMQVTIRLGDLLGQRTPIGNFTSGDLTVYDDAWEEVPVVADVWEHLFTVLTICSFLNECEKLYRQGWAKYCEFFWNYADVALFLFLIAFMIMRTSLIEVDQIFIRNIMGLSSIPLYVRLLELLVLSRRFGPLMLIVQNVLSEVFYFLILALLMIVAFAQTVTLMFNDPPSETYPEGRELPFFNSVSHSAGTLFIAMLGIMDEGQINEMREKYIWTGPLVMILYLLITSVILLNLLIAILSNIYKKIDEKSNEEWMFLWGSTVMRLQKEVSETLPAPLNVVLKLLKVFPKAFSQNMVFFILLLTAYIPGFIIGFVIYTPTKIIQSFTIIFNPMNYKKGRGNPFKGAKVSDMEEQDTEHHHNMENAKSVLSQFWQDNFTDFDLQMRGREGASYQYDSANRGTMMDFNDMKEKNSKQYFAKLSERRDEIKDLLSVTSSDTTSLVADVIAGQGNHSKMLEDQLALAAKMKTQMLQLEKLIHIANRNINALSKSEDKRWQKLEGEIGNTGQLAREGSVRIKDPEEEDEDESETIQELPQRSIRTTKAFVRPRRTTRKI